MAQRIARACKKSPDERRSIDQTPHARSERLTLAFIEKIVLGDAGVTWRMPQAQLNCLSLRHHAHLKPL
jgi:hypothetical protein